MIFSENRLPLFRIMLQFGDYGRLALDGSAFGSAGAALSRLAAGRSKERTFFQVKIDVAV
jgi:hypothetical protein